MPNEGIQGDEWGAYVTLDTYDQDEHGIAYGARALWRRRPVVVAGVTTGQGGRESRPQGEGGTGDRTPTDREVCEMQNAETVLGVLRERGRRGLPLEELYRQLFNPQLYLLAYGRLYSNQGAMTPGVTRETVDGMSWTRSARIIEALRHERYRLSPVTADLHPEEEREDAGRWACRPGRTSWSARWSACCWRRTTSRQFSDHSHGFRPGRGCHTALREVADTWTGTTWFIEGDIAECFGSLDHESCSRSWRRRSTTTGSCG